MGQEREIVTLDDMYYDDDAPGDDTGNVTKADLGSFFGGITKRLPWKKKKKQPRVEFSDPTPVAPTTTRVSTPERKRGLGYNDINDDPESTTGWINDGYWDPGYAGRVRDRFSRKRLETYWPEGTKR